MRKIKFRAWDKINKVMIYNVEQLYDSRNVDEVHFDVETWWSKTHISCNSNFAELLLNSDFEVMQYTGLKDRNGIDIYEGDIIGYPKSLGMSNEEVEFHTDMELSHGRGRCIGFAIGSWEEGIVIGNIYSNPELMEVK